MKSVSKGIHLPFGYDTLLAIILIVGGGLLGYAKFESKVETLEVRMEEANSKIEELVAKHIEDEEKRFSNMEEEIKWYQKNISINPLSWKKKK
tara:strand:+ start:289 stop:567 length:279 start_codon:yes stop_codon:yes gene_type:complete